MTVNASSVRLAAVQNSPIFLDLEASVKKAVSLIYEASRNGANLVAFPEGFLPTHPLWYHFHAASTPEAQAFSRRLASNSVVLSGEVVHTLCNAARDAGIFVVMGCCEREEGRLGTLYNTLLFIDEQGRLLGRHRKLMPTLGERLVHARGDADGLRVYRSGEWLQVSGLMCGENSNPLAVYALDAQGANVHVASWPPHFQLGADVPDIVQLVTRALAYQMKAFVVNAVGTISDEMLAELPVTDTHREYMKTQGQGSSIIGPDGEFLAGPLGQEEGILYADVAQTSLISPNIVQDFAGHYNRFDLFNLSVSRAVPPALTVEADGGDPEKTKIYNSPQRESKMRLESAIGQKSLPSIDHRRVNDPVESGQAFTAEVESKNE